MSESSKKLISIVTPCFNEEGNAAEVYRQAKEIFARLPQYDYEHIFIDNASQDRTVAILKEIASQDRRVKIIVNARNFGHLRSPYHALLQTRGDAAIILAADLQEPPQYINDFVAKWEEGFKIVVGVKTKSRENPLMFIVRKLYYNILGKFADVEQIKNFDGFGLYDKVFLDVLRKIDEPYPYLRGLVCELGFARAEVAYTQAARQRGKTHNSFYDLYDMAMLGFVSHSKIPLRLASFIGFGMSLVSFLVALVYLLRKLFFWEQFQLGLAPLIVGIFFLGSLQLFFIGILGEYLGSVYTQVKRRPLVIEKERINF